MTGNAPVPDIFHQPEWVWKIGLVLTNPQLSSEIGSAISEAGASRVFEFEATTSPFEVANAIQRERPDLMFVELSATSKPAGEWMMDVRHGEETPLIVAVHPVAEPSEMICALRAGASEFLSLPVKPAIYEAMDRIGALLESRRSATAERAKITGILSAKGGCGATSIACHLSAALRLAGPATRVLVADLDYQSPGAHHIFRVDPHRHSGEALDAVRRLSTTSWREFVTAINPEVDLLASPASAVPGGEPAALAEPWRIESLFRFVARQYGWILADLGRHLNPANWMLLQNIDELIIVTAPDVLALYQTRSVLQTLTSRGFDKSRLRIILNRNMSSPQDFWVESIEQMFEMTVFGVIPNDEAALGKLPRDRFEFPAETPFGRALVKIASKIVRPGGPGSLRKAA